MCVSLCMFVGSKRVYNAYLHDCIMLGGGKHLKY